MTERPTPESRPLKVGALLARPDRAAVPGPPSRRPAARPGIAPAAASKQAAPAVSVEPDGGGEAPPPSVPKDPPAEIQAPAPTPVPAATEAVSQPAPGLDLSVQEGKLRWGTLVAEPTAAAVAARKIRKDQPKEQLNVGITFALFHHMARHLDEHNLPKTDVVEALLRAWLAERDDPAPLT